MASSRQSSPANDLDDFWQEFKDIESNKEPDVEEEDLAKTPDEGEQEAAWLQEAGYGFLVSKMEDGKELSEEEIHVLTSPLSNHHAVAVRKRVDTLNATLRKKQKYTTKIDVRNIFPQQNNTEAHLSHTDTHEKAIHTRQRLKLPIPKPLSSTPSHVNTPVADPIFPSQSVSSPKRPDDADGFDFYESLRKAGLKEEPRSSRKSLFEGENIDVRSLGHFSESPLTSPSHSKSSSCDTLDSLDSGLESSSHMTGSHDSLDWPQTSCRAMFYQTEPIFDSADPVTSEFSQDFPSDTPLSPLGSPVLETDDERSPKLIAFRKNGTVIEAPKSPSSPDSDSGHVESSSNRRGNAGKSRDKGSFLKRGGYSMTGTTEEVQDNVELGVEMLSVQSRGTHRRHDSDSYKRSSQLSPISDTDIIFDFNVEEDKPDRTETKASIKSLHKDDLPNYSLANDPLGNTHVDDVSPADMVLVRSVALLELTSMLDTHNIMYTRRRSKRRHKEQGVFGVPLATLLECDQKKKSNTKVPLVFQEILSYLVKHCLDAEGILRVPGLVSRIKQLRQELEEKFYQGTFVWGDDLTPNDVAALMKQFLRELPSPLLTDEYIEAFAQVENLPDRKLQLHALNLLILLLPDVNRNTLSLLLEFLEQVRSHCNVNKMTLSNIAMIMAPNLFLAPKVRSPQAGKSKSNSWDLQVDIAKGTSNIVRMLIKYQKILWTIPSNILSHVRRQYELEQIRKNRDKSKMRFYNKKDKTDVYKKPALIHEADFQEGVIRVQAPMLTKSSTAIQLDDHMTAGEIVSKFRVIQGSQTWDPRKSSQVRKTRLHISSNPSKFTSAGDNTYLFEVGGNIGERCLPHNTNILALYKVNPNAEWIIKQKDS